MQIEQDPTGIEQHAPGAHLDAGNKKVPVENWSEKFYNQSMMFKRFIPFFLIFPLFLCCVTTPVTERWSLMLIPFDQEVKLGEDAYQEILKMKKSRMTAS